MGTHEPINWVGLGEGNYFPDPLDWEHNLRVGKPWRCRLRLHDSEVRENPETYEHYEVCRRCNAYQDTRRPSLSPRLVYITD